MSLPGYDFFKTKRLVRGFTLRELGEETGISFKCIHDIEAGKKEPSFSKVLALCEALNVPVSTFIKYYNEKQPETQKKVKHGARGGTRTPIPFQTQPVAA